MSIRQVFDKYYNGEKNFMTPNVYGYDKRRFGDEYLLIEKSIGEGLDGGRIYGASALVYNPSTGHTQMIDLSECYHKSYSADLHIKAISKSQFKDAKRYGEVKKILVSV